MSAPPGFAEKVAGYSDVQLAKALASAGEYTPEALAIISAEWDTRKLTAAEMAPILAETKRQAELTEKPKPTASKTFKGTGLICYGKDYSQGKGYVTTQWFCAFMIPLIPVQSFHVEEISFGAEGVATPTRFNLRQVGRTYLFLLFAGFYAYGVFGLSDEIAARGYENLSLGFVAVALLVPIICIQLWRRSVRRKQLNRLPAPAPALPRSS